MSLSVMVLLVGLCYVVLVGGLALFRREGLSMRFAIESIIITAAGSGLTALTGFQINPFWFVIFLYLITMRVRLLVDLGSFFTRQGKFSLADKIFTLAARLWPDATSELILMVNQATLLLREGRLDEAVTLFSKVLQQAGQGYLGVKYEAASHFNLGVAYLQKNLPGRATAEFNAVIDTWPISLFAHQAQEALNRLRSKEKREPEDKPAEN